MKYQPNDLLKFLLRSRNLSTIDRCSNTPHIQKYSVAEHSFYISFYSMIFADLENSLTKKREIYEFEDLYDTSEVIKRALIHDLEESITGDILYPFKHNNAELTCKLKEAIENCVNKELFLELPDELQIYYKLLWADSKDDSKEGQLVEAMDKFEILLYAISEMEMGNVNSFKEIYTTAINVIYLNHNNIKTLINVVDKIKEKYGDA